MMKTFYVILQLLELTPVDSGFVCTFLCIPPLHCYNMKIFLKSINIYIINYIIIKKILNAKTIGKIR